MTKSQASDTNRRNHFTKSKFITRSIHALLIFVMLVLFAFRVHDQLNSGPASSDAIQYMTMAFNFVNFGTLSLDAQSTQPQPTAYRAPGYPIFVAAALSITGEARDVDLDEFLRKNLPGVKIFQTFLIFCTAIAAAAMTWQLTGALFLTYVPFFGIACTSALHNLSSNLLSEPLAAFLLIMFAWSLLWSIESKKIGAFISAGALAALLALTRSTFFYVWPLVLILFIIFGNRSQSWRGQIGALTFMAIFLAITGSWMARNKYHFDEAIITERGGLALYFRAQYDQMTGDEYLASFCFWSKCPSISRKISRFGRDDYLRLGRTDPSSYYRLARAKRNELNLEMGNSIKADAVLKREALKYFLDNPTSHLLVTLPMAHRGIYVHSCVVSLFAVTICLVMVAHSVIRLDGRMLAVLLPFVFLFVFTSFFTMAEPRYNQPAIPVIWIAVSVFLHRLFDYANNVRYESKQAFDSV